MLLPVPTPLEQRLRREIDSAGPLPFARFMELALYCPELGYYEQFRDTVGRRGDYFTSVAVGPLFGELLAFQFQEWLPRAGPAPRVLVEAGAHDGRLAADILAWFRRFAAPGELEYWIVEPSARRRAWQADTLRQFAPAVRWWPDWSAVPAAGITGIIFSNELLDAFPVERWGWDRAACSWFRWAVTTHGDRFVWTRLPPAHGHTEPSADGAVGASRPPDVPPELAPLLPDGFTLELSPQGLSWWHQAARALRQGQLLTFDYGLTEEEWLAPHRPGGTLRAYHRHTLSPDPLAHPGEQDLTAHVNLTRLQRAGEEAGLRTAGLESQARFLTRVAEATWRSSALFPAWDPARRRQFRTLTHPEHLGTRFKVLLQSR